MKKIIINTVSILAVLISNNAYAKDVVMGKEITLKENTNINQLIKTPKNFLGKTVLIKGKVLDVCTEQGCWMKVSGANKNESIFVKVKDGDMVFPIAAKGKDVIVEGELYKVNMSKKDDDMDMKEAAGEAKVKKIGKDIYVFKPKAVKFSNIEEVSKK